MSIRLAPAVEELIRTLSALPGLGPRSAQRAAFFLLQNRKGALDELASALNTARRGVGRCRLCNTFTEGDICSVCADEDRDPGLICVVESVADQMALDASLAWPGLYFVLNGRLSPVEGIGPADIGMPQLLKRIGAGVEEGVLREAVVATSYTPEGDATAYYLIDALKKRWPQLRVTRLARGLPSGIEIEYTDLSTIANAVYSRRDV
ncbi:MAG: recombination protein RecR [Sutterella sp.]|nr:recombination protein RecR [Sutterella sp.]